MPYKPTGTKGSIPHGPRLNSRGIELTTGEFNATHGLSFSNPEQSPRAYQESLKKKQQEYMDRVAKSRLDSNIGEPTVF